MTLIPDDAPVYSMAVAERMSGLTPRRMRYYESMGLVDPFRTSGNRRLYSRADLDRLAEIKELLEEGYSLRALAGLARDGRWPVRRRDARNDGPRDGRPGRAPAGHGTARPAAALEVEKLGPYEDARARLLGRGPQRSLDQVYPGEAGRFAVIRPAERSAGRPGVSKETRRERGK